MDGTVGISVPIRVRHDTKPLSEHTQMTSEHPDEHTFSECLLYQNTDPDLIFAISLSLYNRPNQKSGYRFGFSQEPPREADVSLKSDRIW